METDSKIFISNLCPSYEINLRKAQGIVERIMTSIGLDGAYIDLNFVDKKSITELNATHLQKDTPTDVLSFPQWVWSKPQIAGQTTAKEILTPADFEIYGEQSVLGDLAICPEVAEENAENIGQSLDREITFLMTHGILHLCGHDHHTPEPEALMIGEQNRIINELNEKPTPAWDGLIRRAF